MSFRRFLTGAFALVAASAVGSIARADYSYSTTSGGTTPYSTAGNNLILTGQPTSQVLNFTNTINIQDVEIASTSTPQNLINSTVSFSFTLSIVQTPGFQASTPGTGSVTVSGSILITRSDVGGENSSLVSLNIPSLTIGNTTYTFANAQYAAPTVNSAPNSVGAGNLSVQITPSLQGVPEPASMTLMGLGLVGAGAIARRRKAAVTS